MLSEAEYVALDAQSAVELVESGEVQPGELLDAALARTQAVNPQINAVVAIYEELARESVQRLPGVSTGVLHGVPFLLKDLRVNMKGTVTSNGSRLYGDAYADGDSEIVRRFKAAGLVTFGKTNTPELGLNITTEPLAHGPTKNPWNLSLTAGGSSGGSAAAVAAGIAPIAHASDGGGSIRIPASCCGVFGLKPTRGRTPSGPEVGDVWSGLSVEGVISRTVRDTAVVLDSIAGPAPGDPYWAPPMERPLLDAARSLGGKALRIGFSVDATSGVAVDDACKQAVVLAMEVCERLGHHVEERPFAYSAEDLGQSFRTIVGAHVLVDLENRAAEIGRALSDDMVEHAVARRASYGAELSAADYARALMEIQRIGRAAGEFFEGVDVYVTPTLAKVPQPLGTFDADSEDVDEFQRRVWEFIPFTAVWNITGQPAMSVPIYWTDSGEPVGVQFAARLGSEVTLVSLASQIEEAAPWIWRYQGLFPPVS